MRMNCVSVWDFVSGGKKVDNMRKKNSLFDKKSASDFVQCTTLAFTLQTVVSSLVMFLVSSETAAEQSRISSIYETPGFLSKETLMQFLVVALLSAVIRHIFMSGKVVKVPSVSLRVILTFVCEIVMVGAAVWLFEWFHSVRVGHWIGFVIGALPCIIAGGIMAYKGECKENEEMNAALRKKQSEE